jgi:hypothetical protein
MGELQGAAPRPASFGDALIFMTKGVGALLALALVLACAVGGWVWWDSRSYKAAWERERTLASEGMKQIVLLQKQRNALRVQLAPLEQTLGLERQKIKDQQTTITDLGSKLNACLADFVGSRQ